MARGIANHARDTLCWPVLIDAMSNYRWLGRFQPHAGMIVVKNEDPAVLRVDGATHARVTGTEIAIVNVWWSRSASLLHRLTTPGTILPVGGDNHPFFPEGMPSLFPCHGGGSDPVPPEWFAATVSGAPMSARADSRIEAICRRLRRALRS